MLELDVHLTRDNVVVVAHDLNLTRSTGLNQSIQQIDFQDLPPLKTNLTLDFDPGVTFESKDQTDRRIPSLEQVFQTFPSVPINIDIKDNDDRLIEHVSRLINRYNRTQHTVWGHVNSKISKKLYKQNPEVNRFFSMQRVAQLLFLYYSGLLPFVPIKETHLEIFLPQIFKKYLKVTSVASKPRLVQLVDFLLIRKSLFEHLQKRGIHVYLWVLNNEEEFEAASKLGVNAIMTDYPTRLDQYLKSGPSKEEEEEEEEEKEEEEEEEEEEKEKKKKKKKEKKEKEEEK
ncbi:hypothetical protein M8J77_005320 [Diaphorina citri]|nr:hypothetical protein M8J77_005320 [Diaphorina citri]